MRCLGAAVLAYALFFQGLVGAYAQAAMAGETAFVICSPLGTETAPGETDTRIAHTCCIGVCKHACRCGPATLGGSIALAAKAGFPGAISPERATSLAGGLYRGHLADARGPPVSI